MADQNKKITDKQKRVLLDWMRKIHQLEYAHRFESLKWANAHKWIGISAFVLSLIIAFWYSDDTCRLMLTDS